jgi:hypothetical protein
LAYFKFIVLALNSLAIAVLLGVGIPMIVVERSFWLLFVILLILAPFVTLVIYAIFCGKMLVWWGSLVGSFFMAIGIVFWYLSYGMFIDDGESSISVLVVHQVFFVGSITVLNLIYLPGGRQRETAINSARKVD